MKRYALVFLAAIFLPSLVLGWLALRTASGQRVLIERQTADLHQVETDLLAGQIRERFDELQRIFTDTVRELVASRGVEALAETYGPTLSQQWPGGGMPFAISPQGRIAYPPPALARNRPEVKTFLEDNTGFLSNEAPAAVYSLPSQQEATISQLGKNDSWEIISKKSAAPNRKSAAPANRNILPQTQKGAVADEAQTSKLSVEVSDFQTAVAGAAQGTLARFVQDELQVLFWTRPDPSSEWLFGVMFGPKDLNAFVANSLPNPPPTGTQLAVLNDKTRPVVKSPEDFTASWNRPFVASEIGEILPHWEVALYLVDPGALTASAQLVSLTLVLLIALALGAILVGGYLVALDTRRQLALAQKKTDFVSNVSHELKTPLTSIRMFAELLAEDRVKEPEKRSRYLRIIAGESERLTRLVNNVLDFARLEKNRKNYTLRPMDARELIGRVWETESLRLREAGFDIDWQAESGIYPVRADADALAQILVNLISNAEKYHGERREILLASECREGRLSIAVSDRGPGVPREWEKRIFEAFFRVDDSLTGEVPGSGLGLTLARRIARDHGGDVSYRRREGGGSTFTLTLPLHS